MSIIAFIAPFKGQVANTSNLVATALHTGLSQPVKSLVMHTDGHRSKLESYFIKDKNKDPFEDIGVDSLFRLASSRRLTKEKIVDYTHPILSDHRLDLLQGTNKATLEGDLESAIGTILQQAREFYDFVFVDAGYDGHPLVQSVIQKADIVVVSLNQNITLLENFFEGKLYKHLKAKQKVFVLGQYEKDSRYTMNNISRKFSIKEPIFVVPRNIDFMDASNDTSVVRLFMRNRKLPKNHRNHYFTEEVQKLSDYILKARGGRAR